jgi:hypothetical protein
MAVAPYTLHYVSVSFVKEALSFNFILDESSAELFPVYEVYGSLSTFFII